ncbi:hypothetical protein [Haloarcula sp. Atlit-120R]|uniref:hypothetical protein n=1 Tax=Haloarcula sp. Atlit-120R TaxID=2282135 RepID=UPI00131407D5|nr:hypothetical protein [Haloarcula sp. Atlit-120R]
MTDLISTKVGYDFGNYRILSGAPHPNPANVADRYSGYPELESDETCGTAG